MIKYFYIKKGVNGMVTIKSLIKEFESKFDNMYYDDALQVVGKMKSNNYEKQARYYEGLVYFEQGKYVKVRNLLKESKSLSQEEEELLVCSLLKLELFDEFNAFYHNMEKVSAVFWAWLEGIRISGELKLNEIEVLDNIYDDNDLLKNDSYIYKKYKWFLANTLADIYSINDEKVLMIEAGMDESEVDYLNKKVNNKINCLKIKGLPYFNEIIEAVKKDKRFDDNMVLFALYSLCATKDYSDLMKNKDKISAEEFDEGLLQFLLLKKLFDNVSDVINYLRVFEKIKDETIEMEFSKYHDIMFEGLKNGNDYCISLTKEIIINRKIKSIKLTKEVSIVDEIQKKLIEYCPYALEDLENHSMDSEIESILTDKGKFAYRAAIWQFEKTFEAGQGTLDAGMLCLSYMRILELEVNQRIIIPLLKNYNEINDIFLENINRLNEEEKKTNDELEKNHIIKERKDYISQFFFMNDFKQIKEKKLCGCTMGSIHQLFVDLSNKRFNNKNYEILRSKIDEILKEILSDFGNDYSNRDKIQRIFSNKNIQKYRNPPAHTRYVNFNTALECKRFVEDSILFINKCIK